MKTAYLGPEASFSHQAALEALPGATAVPLPSFTAIFSALQSKDTEYDYAVLPVENSTNGAVVQVLDLLVQSGLYPATSVYEDVEVVAEHYLSVHHCLFVTQQSMRAVSPDCVQILSSTKSQDSTALSEALKELNVKTLFTHPQVWGQCGKFLGNHLPLGKVERIDISSTSAAAAFVAKHSPEQASDGEVSANSCVAAISAALAGQKNGLFCLAENIEDFPGENTTRFLVLRNRRKEPLAPIPDGNSNTSQTEHSDRDSAEFKSLITFTIPHSTPGSLASALSVFSQHGFNLTAIQSRPSHVRNWHYVFFVECQRQVDSVSHQEGAENGTGHGKLDTMLVDLKQHTERVRWLGSWKDQLQHKSNLV